MEVMGWCRKCKSDWFDAHWHNFPNGVYCVVCKSKDIHIETDESIYYNMEENTNELDDNS